MTEPTTKPVSGDIFPEAIVKAVKPFGAFVEYAPGQEALVHISQIADEYVADINDYVQVGQTVSVKCLGEDQQGRVRLSMKS